MVALFGTNMHNTEAEKMKGKQIIHSAGPENLKMSRRKKLMKSNDSIYFREIAFMAAFSQYKNSFLAIFEIGKNGI